MKIAVAYTVVSNGPISDQYASRFAATFHEFPPGSECDLMVIGNGGPMPLELSLIFAPLNARMFLRSNENKDLGGYLAVARDPAKDYDMLVALGESVYFHRAGWLKRLVEAWEKHGEGMYGMFSSNLVRPHLQTTAFCTSPLLLRKCPISIEDRYPYEHGQNSFWRWVARCGKAVRLVTWDGEWLPMQWRVPRNILWRGDQSNLLMWANHTQRYVEAAVEVKAKWSRGADQPYR